MFICVCVVVLCLYYVHMCLYDVLCVCVICKCFGMMFIDLCVFVLLLYYVHVLCYSIAFVVRLQRHWMRLRKLCTHFGLFYDAKNFAHSVEIMCFVMIFLCLCCSHMLLSDCPLCVCAFPMRRVIVLCVCFVFICLCMVCQTLFI